MEGYASKDFNVLNFGNTVNTSLFRFFYGFFYQVCTLFCFLISHPIKIREYLKELLIISSISS